MLSFKKKVITNDSGFTLVEALVTIGIIAIMSAVYLANYRPTNQKIALDQAVAGLVSDLRYAQNMAMNVKKFEDAIPQGGYGLKINNTSPGTYTIYADCDNDHRYGLTSQCGPGTLAEKVSDRALDSKINITSASVDIAFQPPNPIVWINSATGVASSTITLRYGDIGGPTRTITINGYTGQISVN